MKTKLLIMSIALAILFGFMIGLCVGIETGERKAFENLGIMFEGSTINFNFNETYIMDRVEEITFNATEYVMERFGEIEFTNFIKNCTKDYTGRTC